MANKELIYKDDARRAVLKANPAIAFCIDNVKAVNEHLYTLEQIATEICCKTSRCDDCPGKPYCNDGHDGVHEWLRMVMEGV